MCICYGWRKPEPSASPSFLAFVAFSLKTLIQSAAANRDDLIFFGLSASLARRFWPLSAGTSFYSVGGRADVSHSWLASPLLRASA
jgi:hypothetical protein